jgi:hypothetical protein
MDVAAQETTVATALALSKRTHETVEAMGIPELSQRWQERVDRRELSERIAVRLIAVGAVFPSDALMWLAACETQLAQSADACVRLVVDDDDLAAHGLVLSGTVAETLGRTPDVPIETAKLLLSLLKS